MNYLPDKFEVANVFFGGGVNKLYLNNDMIIFSYEPEYGVNLSRNLELTPLEDEWNRFGGRMDEIGAWSWKEKYVTPDDILMDGNIINTEITYNGHYIKTFCWCIGPPTLIEFYKAIKNLDISSPGGIGRY